MCTVHAELDGARLVKGSAACCRMLTRLRAVAVQAEGVH
jgi:hypothetical protein